MQLGDNDALNAVDDKSPVVGHERDLAHIDFLFLDVLDGLVTRILVVDNKSSFDLERHRVSYTAELTLLDVKYRLPQPIADILKRCVA